MIDVAPGDVVELREDAEWIRLVVVSLNPLLCRTIATKDTVGWSHRLGSVSKWTLTESAIKLDNSAHR